jgi:hypothetical protein
VENKYVIYHSHILPLIEQIASVAAEYDIPYIVIAQSSDNGFERSAHIPQGTHKEMRQLWAWLEHNEEEE